MCLNGKFLKTFLIQSSHFEHSSQLVTFFRNKSKKFINYSKIFKRQASEIKIDILLSNTFNESTLLKIKLCKTVAV